MSDSLSQPLLFSPGSSSRLASSTVERRRKVLVGELPVDFLRIVVPNPVPSPQQQQQQQQQQMYMVDPSTQTFFNQGQMVQGYYSFVPPNTRGRVSITIVEAKLAKNYGLVRMDPYCRVRVGNTVFETPSCTSGGKAPKWNRIVHSYLPDSVESFFLQIYDERAFTVDERIAWAHVVIPPAAFNGEVIDDWYPLSGEQGEGKEGMINLVISFTPIQSTTNTQQQQEQSVPAVQRPLYTEEEIVEMQAMFPAIETEVIKSVLEEKRGNKEAAVTALLEMGTD